MTLTGYIWINATKFLLDFKDLQQFIIVNDLV